MNDSFAFNLAIDKFNSILITAYLILNPLFFSSVSIVAKIVLLSLLVVIFLNTIYLYKTVTLTKLSLSLFCLFLFFLIYCWFHTYFVSKIPFESKLELTNIFLYTATFYIFYFFSKNRKLEYQIKLSFFIVQVFLFIIYLFYGEKIVYFFVYNPNILSGYCLMCFLFCLGWVYENKKVTMLTILNLCTAGLFLILLRNISGLYVIILFFLTTFCKNFFVLFFSIVSLIVTAITVNPVSFFDRLVWDIIGLRVLKNNFLFGVGLGNFKFFYPQYVVNLPFLPSVATTFVHNYFLHMTTEIGVLWLVFFSFIVYFVLRNIESTTKTYIFPLIGILIQNFVEYNLVIPQNSVLFFIFLSFILADVEKESLCVTVKEFKYFLPITVFVICISGIWYSVKMEKIIRKLSSQQEKSIKEVVQKDKTCWRGYKQLAIYAIQQKKFYTAKKLLLETVHYNPADAESFLYLSMLSFNLGEEKLGYKFLLKSVLLNPRWANNYVKFIRNRNW